MMFKAFSVYDCKVESYMQPFFAPTTGSAIRSFQDAAQDPNHQFAKHLGDYTLFEIGQYDDSTGMMEPHKVFNNLGTALSYSVKEA